MKQDHFLELFTGLVKKFLMLLVLDHLSATVFHWAIWQWRNDGGGLGGSNPPRNSEDIGGVLDSMSKKNWRLDFLL